MAVDPNHINFREYEFGGLEQQNGMVEWTTGVWNTGLDYRRGVAFLRHAHVICGHCASCARKIDITS